MIKKIISSMTRYPLAALFSLWLLAFLFIYVFKADDDFSSMENRFLAARPSISLASVGDKTFMEDFEDYCEDQLPFRDFFVKAKAVCETVMLKCENNGIAKGQNGYLFEKVTGESSQLDKNIAAITQFVKLSDRNVYIAVAPNSSYVYDSFVPMGMPVLDEDALAAKLTKALEEYENARVIDLNRAMKSASADDLYYKTDHHWSSYGAYVAYETIAQCIGFTPVSLDGHTEDQADDFYGTYYAKYKGVGVKSDILRYYDFDISEYNCDGKLYNGLYDTAKLDTYDKYAMFMYGNPGKGIVKCTDEEKPALIILKDSYANSLIPFLTDNYGTIVTLDLRYLGESVSEVINEYPNADILLLYDWSFVNEDNHFYKLVK